MKEMKEIIKSKTFVINEFILKNIKKINIDLDEFLLILYFINVSNVLDINEIKKFLNLTEEEILNTFNSLISKKLIEVVINNDGKKVDEEISLDLFYNKLLLNMDDSKEVNNDIFSLFESEFGRTLSPIEYETINSWLEKRIDEDTIKRALKEAVLNEVTNIRYVDKIIYEWSKKKNNVMKNEEEVLELFDYNWLEENNEEVDN